MDCYRFRENLRSNGEKKNVPIRSSCKPSTSMHPRRSHWQPFDARSLPPSIYALFSSSLFYPFPLFLFLSIFCFAIFSSLFWFTGCLLSFHFLLLSWWVCSTCVLMLCFRCLVCCWCIRRNVTHSCFYPLQPSFIHRGTLWANFVAWHTVIPRIHGLASWANGFPELPFFDCLESRVSH